MQHPAVQGLQLYPVPIAYGLSVGTLAYRQPSRRPEKKEISYQAVYHHYRKWSRDGSLERVFQHSILTIRDQLDTRHLNLDGSHAPAKKGGEAVAYQGRKKAKTSNILPITDANGFILATTGIIAGNHNDAFELKDNLRAAFKFIKRLGISIVGSYFNADTAFDTQAARRTCFNHKVIPNIVENKRSRKRPNADPNGFSMLKSTNCALPVSGCLLGLINSAPCWFALTAKSLTSWVLITSFSPLSTSVTYWLGKSLNEFVPKVVYDCAIGEYRDAPLTQQEFNEREAARAAADAVNRQEEAAADAIKADLAPLRTAQIEVDLATLAGACSGGSERSLRRWRGWQIERAECHSRYSCGVLAASRIISATIRAS